MDFNLRDFENLNLYSNRNMEKIVGSLVNETSNAVLVNMFEDSLILLDHVEGNFYVADYNFNREKLTLTINNFEKVNLIKEEVSFQDKVMNFLEDEATIEELAKSYKEDVIEQDIFINDLVNEAMSKKNFDNYVNYEEIKEAIDETELTSLNTKLFEDYSKRLLTHPLENIKTFDWINETVVSLVETEKVKVLNKNVVEEANNLWKKESFKKDFLEATEVFVEDVAEGTEMLTNVFEEYPQVFFLNNADRKTMLGKTLINTDLRENMKDVIKGIDLLFEKFDLKELKEQFLNEAETTPPEDTSNDDETDKATEVEPEDLKKVVTDLKGIVKTIEDEKTKEKIDNLITDLEKITKEGTKPDVVKEAVSILSLGGK